MDCTYKGVGGWEEGAGGRRVGGGGGWEARGWLYLPIGLFGVAMSPRSVSYRPRQDCMEGLKRRLTNTGVNIRPISLI